MPLDNNYVFKENAQGGLEFVGDFEGLYKNVADPWFQSGVDVDKPVRDYYAFSRKNLLDATAKRVWYDFRNYASVAGLEVGCGHGHVVDILNELSSASVRWEGVDISPTAIKQAQKLYPDHRFHVDSISSPGFASLGMTLKYDMVVWGQLLWYIASRQELFTAVQNTYDLLNKNGVLIISQAFLRKQRYGTDLINGWEGLLQLCAVGMPSWFKVIEAQYDDSQQHTHNDGIVVLRRAGQR